MKFSIDFFELSFLAEACIPPRPIARAMFWDKLIDEHYHQMLPSERNRLFSWITTNSSFSKENEDCRLFYARFNPNNQYKVTCFHNGKAGEVDCFRFNEKYCTAKNRYINEEYITKVEKITPHEN